METRWYLEPGQTLENTKTEERSRALHVTKDGWLHLTRHLDRNRLNQEAIDRELAHQHALKKGSEDMTKTWDNSVENIRKRKEEQRLARIAKEEQEKLERFYKLRSEQEAIRQQYIQDARKKIYLTKGTPKGLTSALILSEVLYERKKQLEFDQKIIEHEREEEADYAEKIRKAAQDEENEKKEAKQNARKQRLETGKFYLNTIKNNEEARRKEREDRVRKEEQDIYYIQKEMAKIKQFEEEDYKQRKADVQKELTDFLKEQEQTLNTLKLEEEEKNNIIDIYSKAKRRIDCMRKKKEEEIQKALQLRRDAAAKRAVAAAEAKGEEEERIIKKAQEETEQQELQKLEAQRNYRQQLIKDRQEDRERYLKREEQRKFEENEVLKWQMLNRFKTNDVIKESNKQKEEEEWQRKLDCRKYLNAQKAEDNAIERKRIEMEEKIHQEQLDKNDYEDNQFFDYADEVLEYAKKKGRSTVPIQRCINEYRKTNNLSAPYYTEYEE